MLSKQSQIDLADFVNGNFEERLNNLQSMINHLLGKQQTKKIKINLMSCKDGPSQYVNNYENCISVAFVLNKFFHPYHSPQIRELPMWIKKALEHRLLYIDIDCNVYYNKESLSRVYFDPDNHSFSVRGSYSGSGFLCRYVNEVYFLTGDQLRELSEGNVIEIERKYMAHFPYHS